MPTQDHTNANTNDLTRFSYMTIDYRNNEDRATYLEISTPPLVRDKDLERLQICDSGHGKD